MLLGSRTVRVLKGSGSRYWMVLPAFLTVLAIVAYPLAFATYYSFWRVLPNLAGEFIGLENYSLMLEDPDFAEALKTTLVFTAATGGTDRVTTTAGPASLRAIVRASASTSAPGSRTTRLSGTAASTS